MTIMWNLVSAVIGGLIGGGFAILAVWVAHRNDLQRQHKTKQAEMKGFYHALLTETQVLWEQYMWGMGKHLESLLQGEPLLYYYPVTQDYFTVFEKNAHLIGQVQNVGLRQSVVEFYTKAKGLIDSYRFCNHLVSEYENKMVLAAETNNPLHVRLRDALLQSITQYTGKLKESHNAMKEKVVALSRMLNREIENTQ